MSCSEKAFSARVIVCMWSTYWRHRAKLVLCQLTLSMVAVDVINRQWQLKEMVIFLEALDNGLGPTRPDARHRCSLLKSWVISSHSELG